LTGVATACLLAAVPAGAVEYAISISNDNDTTNGDCSLREALYAATHNVARDACPAGSPSVLDRITLYSSVTFDGGMFWVNDVRGGELEIRGATAVASETVINLAFSNRFLYLLQGDPVTIKNVQILFGDAGSPRWGGVIRAGGTSLTLFNVDLGLSNADLGGTVYFLSNSGDHWLRIVDSTIAGNTANEPHGGGL
jgi:CSLREA domain-containing protein